MSGASNPSEPFRAPVTRARVFEAALALADECGIAALTMRSLAERLGVKAMSLYHHVRNKDEVLDGIVDLVFAEIELPTPDEGWRDAMERRTASVREALLRHPWAIGLMDARASPGPATFRHHEAVVATLRGAGFTVALAAHAFAVLDGYVYGFALQELSLPFQSPAQLEDVARPMLASSWAEAHPHLAEMALEHALKPGYSFGDSFGFGLDLILGGLEAARAQQCG